VINTELKSSSKRKDWQRRGWEQVVVGVYRKWKRSRVFDGNCSIELVALARLWLGWSREDWGKSNVNAHSLLSLNLCKWKE